jgi:predicted kinase
MSAGAGRVLLLCGPVGSGKSSFARALVKGVGAVHLSLDEWMIRLFGRELQRAEHQAKLGACYALLIDHAATLALSGVTVVLDGGFWHRRLRDGARSKLEARGVEYSLCVFELPDEERWARLERRNAALGEFDYEITREMFDFFATCYEPPEPDESFRVVTGALDS